MNALTEVFVREFYRRNTLFFTLTLGLLIFVMRPAYLIMSPPFVQPMLEDLRFFGVVMGIIGAYFIKCVYESYVAIRRRENQFVSVLGGASLGRLMLIWVRPLTLIMAPGMLYLAVIAGYSIHEGTWHAGVILLGILGLMVGASLMLAYATQAYRDLPIRQIRWLNLEALWKNSYTYLLLGSLWHRFQRMILLHKALIAVVLTFLIIFPQLDEPMNSKSMVMSVFALACLQTVFAYWVHSATDRPLLFLRNLPFTLFQRIMAYTLVGLVLFLPEVLLWFFWLSDLVILNYVAVATGLFVLGIAILHYKPYPLSTFLGLTFGMFCVGFVAVLYRFPLGLFALGAWAYGVWIFTLEYDAWEPVEETD